MTNNQVSGDDELVLVPMSRKTAEEKNYEYITNEELEQSKAKAVEQTLRRCLTFRQGDNVSNDTIAQKVIDELATLKKENTDE